MATSLRERKRQEAAAPTFSWTESYNLSRWAPSAREGHSLLYSDRLDKLVLFGGLSPGRRHLAEIAVCTLGSGDDGRLEPAWQSLEVDRRRSGMSPRCYMGCALIDEGPPSTPQMLVFGGETGAYPDGPLRWLSDAWVVDVSTGAAKALVPTAGNPPTPRRSALCVPIPDEDGGGGVRVLVLGGCTVASNIDGAADSLHILHLAAGCRHGWWEAGVDAIAAARDACAVTSVLSASPAGSAANSRSASPTPSAASLTPPREARRRGPGRGVELLVRSSFTANALTGASVVLFGGILPNGRVGPVAG